MNKNSEKLCVIGDPVAHSISPLIHNFIYRKDGINGLYEKVRVEKHELKNFVNKAKNGKWLGFNVTIPHKESILQFLDELDSTARKTGAVNTVKLDSGRLIGFNTDVAGCELSLKTAIDNPLKNALIIGSGGAARAAISALLNLGIPDITVLNRNMARAEKLSDFFRINSGAHIKTAGLQDKTFSDFINRADIIINATPVGMWPDTENSVLQENCLLKQGAIVFDMVPRPVITTMLKRAEESGAVTVSGLLMLIFQAAEAHKIWFGQDYDDNLIDEIKNYLFTKHRDTVQ